MYLSYSLLLDSLQRGAALNLGMANLELHVERPKESLNKCNCLKKCSHNKLVGIMQDYKKKSALISELNAGVVKKFHGTNHILTENLLNSPLSFMAAPPILVSYSKCSVYTRK